MAIEVAIYRLEDRPGWSLEVVNAAKTSTIWDELFDTDDEAWAEFRRTVEEEGMASFLDSATVVRFRR